MVWVSFTYMESNLTPQARFNILSAFDEDDGEEHGHKLGGRTKSHMLRVGQFYYRLVFKEPQVDSLLMGLARLFSCRYPFLGDQPSKKDQEDIQDLKTFNKFDYTLQTLLGEKSSWKFPMGPEVQPVDPGRKVSTIRNFCLGQCWY